MLIRVRIAAAELVGELCQQFGPAAYQQVAQHFLLPHLTATLAIQARVRIK